MHVIHSIQRWTFRVTAIVAGLAAVALAVHVVVAVILRVLQVPVLGTVEYIQYLYMPAVSLGAIAATQLGYEHITVSAITPLLRGRILIAARVLALLLMLALGIAVAYVSFQVSAQSLRMGEAGQISGIPLWPAKAMIGAVFSVFSAMVLLQILDVRTYQATGEPELPAEILNEQRAMENI